MKDLNSNWFTEGWVDFELKKYTLLAYLKGVKEQFDQTLLYPAFSDLVFHYRNLVSFREEKQKIRDMFPKELKKIDLERIQLEYVPKIRDDEQLLEIEQIVDYSLPRLKGAVEEGKEIYEFIENGLEIEPLGIMPLIRNEGYLLFKGGSSKEVKAYEYKVTLFENAREKYRGLQTEFIRSFDWSIRNTFESMKIDLIRSRKHLPNPAAFTVISEIIFPESQSLLPVAKRKFMRFLTEY
ncbi:MAG: hypothetical protein H6581_05785 [Bacteroidia bacterium]|nr:hypothetical protein [Bacteroidia bacterium]